MEHTETLIVEQLKTGNEDAYQYIYDRHYALLCHVASGYVRDQFLAETIVGDTIFHLWEIRETLEISVSIRSYLSVIVVSTILIQNGKSARLRFHL
jgi:RNA polymerase sigma-70 factor (ECF subfamily)